MGRRHRRARLLAAASLLLLGCSVESPELPRYETEWVLPLGRLDTTLLELIEDEENLLVGEDGSLSFLVEGDLAPVTVGDQLDLEIEGRSVVAEIGLVELESYEQARFAFRLGELYPEAELLEGWSVSVPGFLFDLRSGAEDLPGFRSAEVASGGIELTLSNGLPVPAGGGADPQRIQLRLLDPSTGAELAAVAFDEAIAPGSTTTRLLDLSGSVLPDSVSIALTGGSPGSEGSLVIVDPDDQLGISVRTTSLTVVAAEAEVGAQSFQETTSVELPDSIQVLQATIGAGSLRVALRNDLPVPVDTRVSLPALLDPQGAPLRLDVALDPAATSERSVALEGYRLDFGGQVGESLDIVVDASSPGSAGASVWIRATDQLSATVDPLLLSFTEITGILDPQRVELQESETTLDIPDELDDLQLGAAELRLSIRHSLGLPARVDLALEGENEAGERIPLAVGFDLAAAPAGRSVEQLVVIDQDNSDILPFLNSLPIRVWVRGEAAVGDGLTVGTVAVDDALSAHYTIGAPLTVSILAQTIDLDPEAIELDAKLREQIEERLIDARIKARVESTLPVAARAWVGIDPDPARVLEDPGLLLGPVTLPAAGPQRGETTGGVVATTTVELLESDVPLLAAEGVYQAVRLEIQGTDGSFVTVRATDTVVVTGFLHARLRMGEDD